MTFLVLVSLIYYSLSGSDGLIPISAASEAFKDSRFVGALNIGGGRSCCSISLLVMGRSPCCEKQGLKKGPWTPEEDKVLVEYIQAHGHGSWRSLPKLAGLQRCGKSCRLRWTNYLRPDIKRGPFTLEEQKTILQLHAIVGNKWSAIAAQLPGRTDNEIKNYWNTHLKKRLLRMGLNPDTYAPASPAASGGATTPSTTRHMAQWESARLEAEARLSRESLLFSTITSSPKQEPDIFLRMWNSEVGDAFRKAAVKTEESSSTKNTSSAVTASAAAATESSSTNEAMEIEDETYRMYLDFTGEELGIFHGQLGSFSLFSTDMKDEGFDA